MIAVGAAIAVAVSYSTPVALLLSEDAPYIIGLTGAAFGLVALLAPLVSTYLPNRVTPLPDGVAIPRRAITFMSAAVTTFLLIALGLALGHARSLVVGQGPSSGMAIAAATLTVIPSFWLAQRPWRRRIELRRDDLVLVAGALGAMAMAYVAYLLSMVFVPSAVTAHVWLTGSLQGRGWAEFIPVMTCLVVSTLLLSSQSRNRRQLALGDDVAIALGVRMRRTRLTLIGTATLLAAAAVATAGPVSFVALVAPHLSRLLTRTEGLLPAALLGGLLLLVSDLVAQHAFALPLPVGVVTVVIGGLFFLCLLWQQGRRTGKA